MPRIFLKIFVPGPFHDGLHYHFSTNVAAGVRVRVQLGTREIIGISGGKIESDAKIPETKPLLEVLDDEPIITNEIFALAGFASDYYMAPLGDLLLSGLPNTLRKGKPLPKPKTNTGLAKPRGYQLTNEQNVAIECIDSSTGQFNCFLLQGVTGSGKTQVFSELIAHSIARKQKVLILVPEIGLTGQMADRIQAQLKGILSVSHSGLSDGDRSRAFVAAKDGLIDVLIGTRSALFTPIKQLGLILVDEEHDSAYKNQEGARYSARDLSIIRAKQANIPIVLSSATPSLETWQAAQQGRYRKLILKERPGAATSTKIELIDSRRDKPVAGLTQTARQAIIRALENGQQALVFLNRRGYAPAMMCADCGWTPECKHCDAKPTLHRSPNLLWCHHCDNKSRPPLICPACSKSTLIAIGHGTERVAEALTQILPEFPIIRIDRDTTARRRSFKTLIEPVIEGKPCVLVGTQMLAKGHDFKHLSTVIVADGDQGLLGADFRSIEHFSQLLMQVTGRAGRHQNQGYVYIQTHRPDSHWFSLILANQYDTLAAALVKERIQFKWPPTTHIALITGRSGNPGSVFEALDQIKLTFKQLNSSLQILGPAPSPMERRNRQYHGQLLLAGPRQLLQWALKETGPWAYRRQGKVVFQLDVDPWDLW